jgi:small subunit ribosomal protein S29
MNPAPKRGTKTLNVKKGRKAAGGDTGKPPAVGERKALRKRIVLSNNNALEVSTLQDLDKNNALSAENEGGVRGIPEEAVDALRAVEAFKRSQGWSLFRRPAVLMRKETVQLAKLMKEVESDKKTLRRIVHGNRMSGKSTLLLQGLLMAHLRDWVIINLPDGMNDYEYAHVFGDANNSTAQDITNAHTEYAPLPGSQPTQYTQETYTANLLSQILKANKNIANLPVKTNPSLPLPLPPNATLGQLIQLGASNPEASWPVFVAVWKELTQPGRPPIMLGLDNLSHAMRNSDYLSAEVKPIHAHDLTILRHFVDHLSGKTALPNGGIVLAATSGSNSPSNDALSFSIQCAEARQFAPETMPKWNPYTNLDMRVMEALKDVDILKVGGLTKEEARSLMEYYALSGVLRARVDDMFVTEKWSLAGMGNVGELERTSVRMRV